MAFYLVQLDVNEQMTLINKNNAMIVTAQAADEALLVAQAHVELPSDAAWAGATATLIADAADLAGWRCKINISLAGVTVEEVEVTGVTVADFDSIAALLVTALNATASIAAAAYATPVLTIAAIGDGIGDHTVTVELLPPTSWSDSTIAFPDFRTTIVHEGIAAAVLQATLIDVVTPEVHAEIRG